MEFICSSLDDLSKLGNLSNRPEVMAICRILTYWTLLVDIRWHDI